MTDGMASTSPSSISTITTLLWHDFTNAFRQMVNNHRLGSLPGTNVCQWRNARRYVSCTRSSASARLRVSDNAKRATSASHGSATSSNCASGSREALSDPSAITDTASDYFLPRSIPLLIANALDTAASISCSSPTPVETTLPSPFTPTRNDVWGALYAATPSPSRSN